MKYANFCDMGRRNINIGDYLQFMAVDYLYHLMNIPSDEIVYLGFQDLSHYQGEEILFPFAYSIIDFVTHGKINISKKIKPVFFSVTLSTIDQFMDLDEFLHDEDNRMYLIQHGPIGCRDEITYHALNRHKIPAYIHGCMTAIFPKYKGIPGGKTLLVDAPRSLLPFIPDFLLHQCEFSTQQYYFSKQDIQDYPKIFKFVRKKYKYYQQTARVAITSRLHVALPLAAFGIPVILAKDHVDGRFAFIENYIPVYSKENYPQINWNPDIAEFEDRKQLIIRHALGRIQGNLDKEELEKIEHTMTQYFQSRIVTCEYEDSHCITHKNGDRFDKYAAQFWNLKIETPYALWGVSENNSQYWKTYIESRYPNAKLTAVFDSFRQGELFGLPYQKPETIRKYPGVSIIVCSIGAAQAALKLFASLHFDKSQFCITADCFISEDDVSEMGIGL